MVWRQNALKAYRALLFAYPAEFRHEYGEEMEQLFAMRLDSEPPVRLWLEVLADAALTAAREHLHILAADIRHGARVLAKTPKFVLTALFAIVLGVSATTTVFSLIDAVVIRSLPYGHAERLVYLWTPSPGARGVPRERKPFYTDMAAWRRMSRSFEGITAMQRYTAVLNDQNPVRVGGAKVLGNFFQTLEATPQLGRTITADDTPFVAVISDGLWRSRFAADPTVLGRTIQIDGHSCRVIGVMPKEFTYPHGDDFPGQYQYASLPRTDLWVPAAMTAKQQNDPEFDDLDATIGRLRPGVTAPQAQAELGAIEQTLQPLHPEGWRDLEALVSPFVETTIGPVRPLLRLLMGAVLLVLLLACGNLAGLLLARGAGRVHEIGVRTALGAERSRLVRLLLTESLMLSGAGGLLALPVSGAALKLVARLNPGDIPRFEETTLDARVLLFALGASLAAGLFAGIFPALSAASVNVCELLRQGGRGIAGDSSRGRSTLIVAEISLAVLLLTGAGLLIRSYLIVQRQDKGFAPSTLTMSVTVDRQRQSDVMNRIRAIPGVEAAGSIDDLPLSTFEDKGFLEVEGDASHPGQFASVRETSSEYFRAMQIPLIAGRYLTDADVRVAAVSESLAKAYFPGRSALGHRLRINKENWSTIVSVLGDVRHSSLEASPEPIVYYPTDLVDSVAIRTSGPPAAILRSVTRVLNDLHAGVSITDVQTMNQYVDQASARRRFQTAALTAFAAVAVLLALVGLYGLLSHAVAQRTAEIGVRMALGASRGEVIRMVVLHGLKLTAAGLAIGISLALAVARVVAAFLYGIPAVDPVTFIGVPAFMAAVAAIACVAPAWKAARIDPVLALRQ
ncbi:conserved membrane hypothetical protein [Candidatus Sulfopaludibacter sp. SbA3]|nr:conserved membrane hypothetical protein [Candidatus Sulfopaludibacter sp. SbA3]